MDDFRLSVILVFGLGVRLIGVLDGPRTLVTRSVKNSVEYRLEDKETWRRFECQVFGTVSFLFQLRWHKKLTVDRFP